MKRYLVFDAGCSVCNNLAKVAQDAAGGKLEAINIRSDEAKALLDQAYPQGWEHAPYFLMVGRGRIRAARGLGAATQLGLLLGPRKAWHVWSLARRSGVAMPAGTKLPFADGTTRRGILKLAASVGAAASLLSLGAIPSAQALPCGQCPYRCINPRLVCGCYCNGCSAGCVDAAYAYDCYDPCNDYCGVYYAGPYCCQCF